MEIEFAITCPNCRKKFRQKLSGMKPGETANCPHCKEKVLFVGDDFSKIQKSLNDIERAVKSLDKKFTIKL